MTNKHAIPWMYTESMVASEAGDWVPLSIDSDLEGRASKLVPALLSETPFLPLEELSWEDFERLQWRLLRDAEGLRGGRDATVVGDKPSTAWTLLHSTPTVPGSRCRARNTRNSPQQT